MSHTEPVHVHVSALQFFVYRVQEQEYITVVFQESELALEWT